MKDLVIIDPSSTEFNRGSFCYLPYIYYSALKSTGVDVELVESFVMEDLDKLPEALNYLVSAWSYPQIDTALALYRFLPKKPEVFGYYPMIKHFGLPVFEVPDEHIKLGIEKYPQFFGKFKNILLSDCDLHLKDLGDERVYPMFTAYGCNKGCSFCPSFLNCGGRYLNLEEEQVFRMLEDFVQEYPANIHFTDEDFFFYPGRTNAILKKMASMSVDFKAIALASAKNLHSFVEDFGANIIAEAGLKLIEVGLETADESIAAGMNKRSTDYCRALAEMDVKADLFWLTMTFFPGETLSSLHKTGQFLKEYGFKPEQLHDRIKTNSTVGGLGQFFQPYHGTKFENKLKKTNSDIEEGVYLSHRPIRLMPSFLPVSLLKDAIMQVNPVKEEDRFWFDLYNVNVPDFRAYLARSVWYYVYDMGSDRTVPKLEVGERAIQIALAARLGIIK